ncbi:hypothetical protein A9239_01725 [Methanosarcina sp. A14]|nr:hypothetical protein A9239_01725 [Methanosarcina sp. A14]
MTICLFDYFTSLIISIVFRFILSSIREHVIRLIKFLNQAIRWLLLQTYYIAISSTEGFKNKGEGSETDDDYGFLNLISPLEIK